MKKLIFIFIINFLLNGNLFAKVDSLKVYLINYLLTVDELATFDDTAYLFIANFNDLNINSIDSNLNFNEIDDGIYKFGIFSPDSKLFMFIKNHGTITIIKDYSVTSVVGRVLLFFDNNQGTHTESDRLKYLSSIINFLSYR